MNYECFIEDFSIHELVGIVTAWMREEYKIYDTQHSHVPFALLESGVFLTRLDVLRVSKIRPWSTKSCHRSTSRLDTPRPRTSHHLFAKPKSMASELRISHLPMQHLVAYIPSISFHDLLNLSIINEIMRLLAYHTTAQMTQSSSIPALSKASKLF